MSTKKPTSIPSKQLPHVSLIPTAVVHKTYRRHPIFWWHKRHFRSVICELVADSFTKILKTEYTDERTGDIFINKKSVEYYLGQKITEHEYSNQQCVEEVREVYVYYLCKDCGIKHKKIKMIFIGPFDIVSKPIETTVTLGCIGCDKRVETEISTESTKESTLKEDCDLAWSKEIE